MFFFSFSAPVFSRGIPPSGTSGARFGDRQSRVRGMLFAGEPSRGGGIALRFVSWGDRNPEGPDESGKQKFARGVC